MTENILEGDDLPSLSLGVGESIIGEQSGLCVSESIAPSMAVSEFSENSEHSGRLDVQPSSSSVHIPTISQIDLDSILKEGNTKKAASKSTLALSPMTDFDLNPLNTTSSATSTPDGRKDLTTLSLAGQTAVSTITKKQKAQLLRMKKMEDAETPSLLAMNYMYILDRNLDLDEDDDDPDKLSDVDTNVTELLEVRLSKEKMMDLLDDKNVAKNQDMFFKKAVLELFAEYNSRGDEIKHAGRDMLNVPGIALRDVMELQQALRLQEQPHLKSEKPRETHRVARRFQSPHWWPNQSTPLDSLTRKILLCRDSTLKVQKNERLRKMHSLEDELTEPNKANRLLKRSSLAVALGVKDRPSQQFHDLLDELMGEDRSSSTSVRAPKEDLEKIAHMHFSPDDPTLSGKSKSMKLAQFYLKVHKVFEFFQFLISHLLSEVPDDPISFLLSLLDKCVMYRAGLGNPPLLYNEKHVEALYYLMDPMKTGVIELDQYKTGLATLGIECPAEKPAMTEEGLVQKEVFMNDTMNYLQYILNDLLRKRFIVVEPKSEAKRQWDVPQESESNCKIPYRMLMKQPESCSWLGSVPSSKHLVPSAATSYTTEMYGFGTLDTLGNVTSACEDYTTQSLKMKSYAVPPAPRPSENISNIRRSLQLAPPAHENDHVEFDE